MSALRRVRASSPEGRQAVARLEERGAEVLAPALVAAAEDLVESVRRQGDAALLAAIREHDGVAAEGPADLLLGGAPGVEVLAVEKEALPPGFAEALETAIAAAEEFHRPQVHPGYAMERDGIRLEERRDPLRRVGVYVPGGQATYPSTVVMTLVPARMAGVEQLVVATPPASYRSHPALRYTLARLEVDEVWGMGGAHGIAALAYGTESISRVDKIVGPGNAWVTAAKRKVLGDVAIDGLAGPSEVLIVADGSVNADWVAADLLAQAEHDSRAAAVLITNDAALSERVAQAVEAQLETLPTAATARASLERFGCAIEVEDLEEAVDLAHRLAPEHLQLVGPRAEALVERMRTAGAVFVGESTPEVFGDYLAGPSHVLPTCGSARFASALGVEDFVRRSHVVQSSAEAARRWAAPTACFADVEGLPAHAAAARRRLP